jgi:hypothetical protein
VEFPSADVQVIKPSMLVVQVELVLVLLAEGVPHVGDAPEVEQEANFKLPDESTLKYEGPPFIKYCPPLKTETYVIAG